MKMVELKGILWKKLQKTEEEKEKPDVVVVKKDMKMNQIKPVEKLKSEEELQKISQLLRDKDEKIRKQEEEIKKKKIEIFKSYDELNTEKLKSMGYDKEQNIIRCVVCRQWKSYDKEKLSELIKKNDVDVIWKYVCCECRKNMKKKRISEKFTGCE